MTWFTITLKNSHLFKIVEFKKKKKTEIDYWLSNFKQVGVF